MKRDYRKQIHALFEELRSEFEIKNELHIMRLQALERLEQVALEENSKKALDEVKARIARGKKKVFIFPLAGKRIEIKEGKIIVTKI